MLTTSRRFTRSDASVPAARACTREVVDAADTAIDGSALDDVLLCVSELATNAVRHGVPVGGALLVKVGADEHRVRVECHDANRRRPRLRHPADDDQTGRGLLLVEALAYRRSISAAERTARAIRSAMAWAIAAFGLGL
ncbi:ATP-binding protein [Streptomyces niveus]|uniref:ATP-binding protein n=1 Tax=Streptomyces niveus TaxID=193462 RepID=UPI0033D04241